VGNLPANLSGVINADAEDERVACPHDHVNRFIVPLDNMLRPIKGRAVIVDLKRG
jgi:hypothetical protein